MQNKRIHQNCRCMCCASLHCNENPWFVADSLLPRKKSTLLFTRDIRASFWGCGAVSRTGCQSCLEGEALCLFPLWKLGLETPPDSGAGSSRCGHSHTA